MTAQFRRSFKEDLAKISDREVFEQLREIIAEVEQSADLSALSNLSQLGADERDFKLRLRDYRLAVTVDEQTLTFVRCLHRYDITSYFLSRE